MSNLYDLEGIHPTAIVSPNAIIGKGNYIGPYCTIGDNVQIGDNNYIGPGCHIGLPPESKDWFKGYSGKVVIGNKNRLMKQVTVDGGTEAQTRIDDGCMILKNAHVGHDAQIASLVILGCNAVIGGWCMLGTASRVDLNSVVNPRVRIPHGVRIGSLSVVLKSSIMEDRKVYAGNPIKEIS